ncbi:ABC transporter permease [Chloroflexota bacterium]
MSLRRTTAIVRKELLHIIRDPRNLFLVTLSPAFLLFLLAYIFSFDVGELNLAVLDLDRSTLSRRYLTSLTSDEDLTIDHVAESYQDALPLLVGGDVDAVLVIPPDFADAVYNGHAVQVQAIVDGSDPLSGRQAIGRLEAKSEVFVVSSAVTGGRQGSAPLEIRTQAWYNAGLESLLSMVPGLMAIVLIMPTMALALALAREKETGTLEGLIVTPISGAEYLIGKLLAYMAPGLLSAILALLMAVLWFGVPFRGDLAVYMLLAANYYLACMGAAIVIASLVKSQQTAMFIVLLVFLVPSFFLAGLINPISTESTGAMLTAYALPSTHFVEISRIVFLKGLGLAYVLRPTLILLGMGIGAMAVGLRLFQKKVV